MAVRITLAGSTGWVGKALVAAIAASDDLELAGAVSRSAAGQDAGEAAGLQRLGVTISATLEEALQQPSDVVIDYTKPNAVKAHAVTALAQGRHVVVGTSGLSAEDYAEIDRHAQGAGKGVLAA
ncbi:MAG: NAD-dependent epimerase/dehydratase family protein, partial [Microvirga sp.]